MRIGIHTLGTRGDVQPYLALATALRSAGHEALLVAPEQFRGQAQSHAVAFAPLPAAFLELLQDPEVSVLLSGGKVGLAATRALLARHRPIMQSVLDAEAEAANAFQPAVIVHHPKALGAPSLRRISARLRCGHRHFPDSRQRGHFRRRSFPSARSGGSTGSATPQLRTPPTGCFAARYAHGGNRSRKVA